MTEPITDEELAAIATVLSREHKHEIWHSFVLLMEEKFPKILARIDADREKIAALKARVSDLIGAMLFIRDAHYDRDRDDISEIIDSVIESNK